jgi:hypothetical protein
MSCLLVSREIVPKHGGVLQVSLWVPLLRVDKYGEIGRVPDEKYWSIIIHPVPITLFSVKLDRKSTRVAGRICRTLLSTNSRESCNTLGLFPNCVKHVNGRDVCYVVCNLKFAIGTSTLGVDNSFRYTLP